MYKGVEELIRLEKELEEGGPLAEDVPAEDAPAEEATAEDAPAVDAPAEEASAEEEKKEEWKELIIYPPHYSSPWFVSGQELWAQFIKNSVIFEIK